MDVPDDEAIPEDLHSIAEDVAADCPDDILHELRDIGFNAFSFLCGAHTFISDGFSAELIDADVGLYIREPAAGRKMDEEHFAFVKEPA